MSSHHTFFNVITIPEGKEDETLSAWHAIGEFMEAQEGFLGSMLYRNARDPRLLINHGRYASVESFMACVKNPEFQRLSRVLTELGVERTAGLYEQIRAFGAGESWSA